MAAAAFPPSFASRSPTPSLSSDESIRSHSPQELALKAPLILPRGIVSESLHAKLTKTIQSEPRVLPLSKKQEQELNDFLNKEMTLCSKMPMGTSKAFCARDVIAALKQSLHAQRGIQAIETSLRGGAAAHFVHKDRAWIAKVFGLLPKECQELWTPTTDTVNDYDFAIRIKAPFLKTIPEQREWLEVGLKMQFIECLANVSGIDKRLVKQYCLTKLFCLCDSKNSFFIAAFTAHDQRGQEYTLEFKLFLELERPYLSPSDALSLPLDPLLSPPFAPCMPTTTSSELSLVVCLAHQALQLLTAPLPHTVDFAGLLALFAKASRGYTVLDTTLDHALAQHALRPIDQKEVEMSLQRQARNHPPKEGALEIKMLLLNLMLRLAANNMSPTPLFKSLLLQELIQSPLKGSAQRESPLLAAILQSVLCEPQNTLRVLQLAFQAALHFPFPHLEAKRTFSEEYQSLSLRLPPPSSLTLLVSSPLEDAGALLAKTPPSMELLQKLFPLELLKIEGAGLDRLDPHIAALSQSSEPASCYLALRLALLASYPIHHPKRHKAFVLHLFLKSFPALKEKSERRQLLEAILGPSVPLESISLLSSESLDERVCGLLALRGIKKEECIRCACSIWNQEVSLQTSTELIKQSLLYLEPPLVEKWILGAIKKNNTLLFDATKALLIDPKGHMSTLRKLLEQYQASMPQDLQLAGSFALLKAGVELTSLEKAPLEALDSPAVDALSLEQAYSLHQELSAQKLALAKESKKALYKREWKHLLCLCVEGRDREPLFDLVLNALLKIVSPEEALHLHLHLLIHLASRSMERAQELFERALAMELKEGALNRFEKREQLQSALFELLLAMRVKNPSKALHYFEEAQKLFTPLPSSPPWLDLPVHIASGVLEGKIIEPSLCVRMKSLLFNVDPARQTKLWKDAVDRLISLLAQQHYEDAVQLAALRHRAHPYIFKEQEALSPLLKHAKPPLSDSLVSIVQALPIQDTPLFHLWFDLLLASFRWKEAADLLNRLQAAQSSIAKPALSYIESLLSSKDPAALKDLIGEDRAWIWKHLSEKEQLQQRSFCFQKLIEQGLFSEAHTFAASINTLTITQALPLIRALQKTSAFSAWEEGVNLVLRCADPLTATEQKSLKQALNSLAISLQQLTLDPELQKRAVQTLTPLISKKREGVDKLMHSLLKSIDKEWLPFKALIAHIEGQTSETYALDLLSSIRSLPPSLDQAASVADVLQLCIKEEWSPLLLEHLTALEWSALLTLQKRLSKVEQERLLKAMLITQQTTSPIPDLLTLKLVLNIHPPSKQAYFITTSSWKFNPTWPLEQNLWNLLVHYALILRSNELCPGLPQSPPSGPSPLPLCYTSHAAQGALVTAFHALIKKTTHTPQLSEQINSSLAVVALTTLQVLLDHLRREHKVCEVQPLIFDWAPDSKPSQRNLFSSLSFTTLDPLFIQHGLEMAIQVAEEEIGHSDLQMDKEMRQFYKMVCAKLIQAARKEHIVLLETLMRRLYQNEFEAEELGKLGSSYPSLKSLRGFDSFQEFAQFKEYLTLVLNAPFLLPLFDIPLAFASSGAFYKNLASVLETFNDKVGLLGPLLVLQQSHSYWLEELMDHTPYTLSWRKAQQIILQIHLKEKVSAGNHLLQPFAQVLSHLNTPFPTEKGAIKAQIIATSLLIDLLTFIHAKILHADLLAYAIYLMRIAFSNPETALPEDLQEALLQCMLDLLSNELLILSLYQTSILHEHLAKTPKPQSTHTLLNIFNHAVFKTSSAKTEGLRKKCVEGWDAAFKKMYTRS